MANKEVLKSNEKIIAVLINRDGKKKEIKQTTLQRIINFLRRF